MNGGTRLSYYNYTIEVKFCRYNYFVDRYLFYISMLTFSISFVYLFIYIYIYLFICVFIHLFIYLFIYNIFIYYLGI